MVKNQSLKNAGLLDGIIGEIVFGNLPFCLKCYKEFHSKEEPDEHIYKNDKNWKKNPRCTMCCEVIHAAK